MSEHSKYLAPSAASRWVHCSASSMAAAQYADPPGESAMEGTAWHFLNEECLTKGSNPSDFLGRTIRVKEPRTTREFVVNRDMATDAALAVDYVRELVKTPGESRVEPKINLGWLDSDFFGRCDVWHYGTDGVLTVADGKYGRVDVPVLYDDGVSLNWQLVIYALGILQELSLRLAPEQMPRRVRLVIIQPRSIQPVPRIKHHPVDVEKIYALEPILRDAVVRVKMNPTFNFGDWCKYCPALGACPASQEATKSLVPILQGTVMTATDAARVLKYEDLLTKIVKQAHAVAQDMLERGVPVPGYKLVTRVKHRQWTDEDLVAQRADGVRGAFKVVTPAQMEKLPGGKEIVAELASVPPGEPVVAPASDKRPPYVARSAEQMFGVAK